MGRVGTGLTAATLPLVIALAFAQSGEVALAVLFGALTALFILGTFAALLPGLHRLPGIGAPRLRIEISANGALDAVVRIPPQTEQGEASARSVLIRVGVRNDSRGDVAHALMNFCFPVGHGLRLCDHRGEPVEEARGRPMPPTQEPEPFDYWALAGLRFTGRNSRLFHFRVRVDAPGNTP
jgi:hypothetical protein